MNRKVSWGKRAPHAEVRAGTITQLAVQQSTPPRIAVFLDGTFAFEVSQELVQAWSLRVGRTLSIEEQARMVTAEQFLAAQVTAFLTFRRASLTSHAESMRPEA